jgi:hypothetical protein
MPGPSLSRALPAERARNDAPFLWRAIRMARKDARCRVCDAAQALNAWLCQAIGMAVGATAPSHRMRPSGFARPGVLLQDGRLLLM